MTKADVPVNVSELAKRVTQDYGEQLRLLLIKRLSQYPARESLAADLAQEVYLRLLRIDGTKQVHKPLAFIYGVASHVLADFRLQAPPLGATFSLDTGPRQAQADEAFEVDDPSLRLHWVQQLNRALRKLPPIQQAVLILLKRDGLSYEEVAQRLGISVDMVSKHAVWAKTKLRTMPWEW